MPIDSVRCLAATPDFLEVSELLQLSTPHPVVKGSWVADVLLDIFPGLRVVEDEVKESIAHVPENILSIVLEGLIHSLLLHHLLQS